MDNDEDEQFLVHGFCPLTVDGLERDLQDAPVIAECPPSDNDFLWVGDVDRAILRQ